MITPDNSQYQYVKPPAIDSTLDGAGDGSNNNVLANPAPVEPPQPATAQPATVPVDTKQFTGEKQQNTGQPAVQSQQPATSNTTTRRTYNIPSTIPDEFKGTTNQELIDYLKGKIAEHKPLSEEELQKLRRKQRTEGIIAGVSDAVRAVANLWFTHNYAPNMYDADKTMSTKTKARFDKEKAERDAADDRYFNYAMSLAKLQGEDRDRLLNIHMMEDNMQRQERAYDDARADHAEDVEFKNRSYEDSRADRAQDVDYRKERDAVADEWKQKEFDEGRRQFNRGIAAGRYSHGGGSRGSGSSSDPGSPHLLGDGSYGYISMANWENDKYIDQLFAHIQYWAKTQGTEGGKTLFKRDHKDPNEKRSIINHYFNQPYGYRDRLGSEIMLFDANYGRKKSK